jgi:hypothetical protein
MKKLHQLSILLSAAVISMAALPAFAQPTPAAPSPADAASAPMDCMKPAVKRHDHGAEKGLGGSSASKSGAMGCANESAMAASGAKGKKKLAHDHAKFHKNQ